MSIHSDIQIYETNATMNKTSQTQYSRDDQNSSCLSLIN